MRILIAEDDPTTLLLLESAIKDWGYDVVAVRNGNAAWDFLRSTVNVGSIASPRAAR